MGVPLMVKILLLLQVIDSRQNRNAMPPAKSSYKPLVMDLPLKRTKQKESELVDKSLSMV